MSYAELSGRALAGTRVQRTAVWDTVQFALTASCSSCSANSCLRFSPAPLRAVQGTNQDNPWWLARVRARDQSWPRAIAIHLGMGVAAPELLLREATRRGERSETQLALVAAMSVAGVRGAITLAGVLTLPLTLLDGTAFPARDLTIFLAAGVIILSLTAASILLPRLLDGLHLPTESAANDESDYARAAAANAAIRAVEERTHDLASGHSDADLYADAAGRVMDLYRRRLEGHVSGEHSMRARRINAIERKLRLAAIRSRSATLCSHWRAPTRFRIASLARSFASWTCWRNACNRADAEFPR